MSRITSLRCAVRPAIFDAASPSTMIVGESTAADLGVHSFEAWRVVLVVLDALFGRAEDANTALLATQEAILRDVKINGRRRCASI